MSTVSIIFVTLHVRESAQAVPLAAANIAAALPVKYHSQTHLIDAYLTESDDQILDKIHRRVPDFGNNILCISFSLYVWNRQRVIGLTQRLRQKYPSAVFLAGGPEATACQQPLIELQQFDRVFAGEGEVIFPAVIEKLLHSQPITSSTSAPGCAIDMAQQVSPWLSGTLQPHHGVLWETARGCPFSCAFCYDARGSHGVREIPLSRLEQELQMFDKANVAQVWVLDSTFNYPAERGKRLLRLMAQHASNCHFHLEAKAEFLDAETVYLLQQISCSVQVGLQSSRPEVLRHINRALDINNFSAKVQMLSDAGITFGIDLIYGLPTDDIDGLRHSINFALQFYPNQVEIFRLALLPGTKLHEVREQYALHAQAAPPYNIISSASMSSAQLLQCDKLAAATSIFYNTGRAMAYFLPLCQACNLTALQFVENFAHWLESDSEFQHLEWWNLDWSAHQVLGMQQRFIPQIFATQGVGHLSSLALDIIMLHSCWSDTLIGPETAAQPLLGQHQFDNQALLERPWQLATTVQVKEFAYPIDELSGVDDLDLIELYETLPSCASCGLFLRRGEQVICESIDAIFATLLTSSTGQQTPKQILAPFAAALSPQECFELVAFASSEGLLISNTSAD